MKDLHLYPTKKSLSQHADDLKTLISSAITNQETCLDGFSHDGGNKRIRQALLAGQVPINLLILSKVFNFINIRSNVNNIQTQNYFLISFIYFLYRNLTYSEMMNLIIYLYYCNRRMWSICVVMRWP